MTALIATLLIGAPQFIQQAPNDVPIVLTGGFSKVKKAEVRIAGSTADWVSVWLRHTGSEKLDAWEKMARERPGDIRYGYSGYDGVPEVSFDKHAVLVMFMGEVGQVAGYSILETQREGDTLTVRYLPRYFSVMSSRPITSTRVVKDAEGKTVRVPVRSEEEKNKWMRSPYCFAVIPRNVAKVRLEEGIIERKGEPIKQWRFVSELQMPRLAGGFEPPQ
jgi:hypothetical protein